MVALSIFYISECSALMQWTEPWLNKPSPPAYPVEFFIGVTGFDSPAEFSLVVSACLCARGLCGVMIMLGGTRLLVKNTWC